MPCFPSLARAEKKLLRLAGEVARRAGGVSHPRVTSALQGRWLEEPEGFPTHVSFRKGNKRTLWPPHGEQKERYAPVGVRPPPPLRGSSPCKAGQFIPAGFDCRHSEVCKSRDSVSLNSLNSFFQMVLNPQECGLFHIVITADFGPFAEFQDFYSSYSHKISAAPKFRGSRNSVGIAIKLSDSEEEKLFVHDSMQVSPE